MKDKPNGIRVKCIECKDKPVAPYSDYFCDKCAEEYFKNIEPSPWF